MRRLTLALLPTALAIALAGCGTVAPAATPPVAPLVSPSTTVAPVPTVPPSTTVAPAATPSAPQSWTMPNLVGENLQDAQDKIQSLTDYGITITYSSDASGRGRAQFSDRNWKVCSQNVRAGTTITASTRIEFAAVKLDERC